MNNRDLPGEDVDWIYSSKKLIDLKSARNPVDETPTKPDIDEDTTLETLLNKKDPIFNELNSRSKHEVLKEALNREISLELGDSKLQVTKEIESDPTETVKKMAEGKATAEDLRSALHSYDPLCNCDRCNSHLR